MAITLRNTKGSALTYTELDNNFITLQTITSDASHAASSKVTPVDADEIPLVDSAASFGLKKLSWANLKTVLFGSPALTGTPTAPTAAAATNTTQLATTAHVFAERSNTATLTNKTLTNARGTLSSDIRLAAVTASLPSLTFVDACFHLAKDDTDKGAWRKRKGQSWRSEARSAGKYLGVYSTATTAVAAGGALTDVYYNTTNSQFEEITNTGTPASTVTYRTGREDYPTNALITAEAGRLIVWDLDGAVPSMWMVFNSGANTFFALSTIVSISIIDRTLCVSGSTSQAFAVVNFIADRSNWISAGGVYTTRQKISGRNDTSSTNWYQVSTSGAIVNSTVNDIAVTVLPDAPLDEYGMPVPNIAVATAGGVSEIQNDGTVKNSLSTAAAYGISYDDLNRIRWNTTTEYNCSPVAPRAASFTASSATEPKLSAAAYSTSNVPISPAIATATGKSVKGAIASTNGLTIYRAGQSSSALHAAVTSIYNTGFMVGDIRRAFLANSKTVDRSIKAGTLTEVGTITETVNAGGINTYSGWSASNYVREDAVADIISIGTGDIHIQCWFNKATSGTPSLPYMFLVGAATSYLRAYITESSGILSVGDPAGGISSSSSVKTATWMKVDLVVRSGVIYAYLNGVLLGSRSAVATMNNVDTAIVIGQTFTPGSSYYFTGYLSLFRISATAPSADQIKYMYASEAPLFVSGNACLLSNSSSVSALSYDKDTDTLLVGNGTNVDTFQGLKRIASQAHGVTTLTSLASVNGRKLIAGTGATYTAPERNISAELLEAQTTKPRTQNYSFTSSGTTQALPKGWKAQGVLFNLTDGTMSSASQTFDGFLWTLASLTTAKAYQIQLVEA